MGAGRLGRRHGSHGPCVSAASPAQRSAPSTWHRWHLSLRGASGSRNPPSPSGLPCQKRWCRSRGEWMGRTLGNGPCVSPGPRSGLAARAERPGFVWADQERWPSRERECGAMPTQRAWPIINPLPPCVLGVPPLPCVLGVLPLAHLGPCVLGCPSPSPSSVLECPSPTLVPMSWGVHPLPDPGS